ncbi:MAG: MFS transporter [Acidobacteriia bacterium]|nr:MFS transporter [Terriglobia bacterium]
MPGRIPLRWIAIGVFVLSSSLNYLDRQLLAALAPTLRGEFQLSNQQYGLVVSVFAIVYAAVAPAAGWFIDRVGLNRGAGISVALWSLAGTATAWTRSFSGLLACRTILGAAEAAGIPATGKANATYLEPRELALGTAFNQVGITLGSVAAPLLVTLMQPRYGWRSTFALCGALGFLWIPLWLFTSKRVPEARVFEKIPARSHAAVLLRDRRFWGIALANAFVMTLYALWSNWTTLYFVQERHMTQDEANRQFAWIPAVFATAGGFFGGVLSYRWIRSGMNVLRARMRICWISAVILLATAAVPLMPQPALAAAAISLSFFWTLAISTNVYALPIDLFGPAHAGLGVAALTCSFGLMTALLSPWIGGVVDRVGFAPVCVALSTMPLLGVAILRWALRAK